MTAYLHTLELPNTILFDAQGNHFDRGVLGIRAGPLIGAWADGAALAHHTFPPEAAIRACQAELSRCLQEQGHTTVDPPFPPLPLVHAQTTAAPPRSPDQPHCTAEVGRGNR
eukprot:12411726-Prorocentrum_lima.AAC.1